MLSALPQPPTAAAAAAAGPGASSLPAPPDRSAPLPHLAPPFLFSSHLCGFAFAPMLADLGRLMRLQRPATDPARPDDDLQTDAAGAAGTSNSSSSSSSSDAMQQQQVGAFRSRRIVQGLLDINCGLLYVWAEVQRLRRAALCLAEGLPLSATPLAVPSQPATAAAAGVSPTVAATASTNGGAESDAADDDAPGADGSAAAAAAAARSDGAQQQLQQQQQQYQMMVGSESLLLASGVCLCSQPHIEFHVRKLAEEISALDRSRAALVSTMQRAVMGLNIVAPQPRPWRRALRPEAVPADSGLDSSSSAPAVLLVEAGMRRPGRRTATNRLPDSEDASVLWGFDRTTVAMLQAVMSFDFRSVVSKLTLSARSQVLNSGDLTAHLTAWVHACILLASASAAVATARDMGAHVLAAQTAAAAVGPGTGDGLLPMEPAGQEMEAPRPGKHRKIPVVAGALRTSAAVAAAAVAAAAANASFAAAVGASSGAAPEPLTLALIDLNVDGEADFTHHIMRMRQVRYLGCPIKQASMASFNTARGALLLPAMPPLLVHAASAPTALSVLVRPDLTRLLRMSPRLGPSARAVMGVTAESLFRCYATLFPADLTELPWASPLRYPQDMLGELQMLGAHRRHFVAAFVDAHGEYISSLTMRSEHGLPPVAAAAAGSIDLVDLIRQAMVEWMRILRMQVTTDHGPEAAARVCAFVDDWLLRGRLPAIEARAAAVRELLLAAVDERRTLLPAASAPSASATAAGVEAVTAGVPSPRPDQVSGAAASDPLAAALSRAASRLQRLPWPMPPPLLSPPSDMAAGAQAGAGFSLQLPLLEPTADASAATTSVLGPNAASSLCPTAPRILRSDPIFQARLRILVDALARLPAEAVSALLPRVSALVLAQLDARNASARLNEPARRFPVLQALVDFCEASASSAAENSTAAIDLSTAIEALLQQPQASAIGPTSDGSSLLLLSDVEGGAGMEAMGRRWDAEPYLTYSSVAAGAPTVTTRGLPLPSPPSAGTDAFARYEARKPCFYTSTVHIEMGEDVAACINVSQVAEVFAKSSDFDPAETSGLASLNYLATVGVVPLPAPVPLDALLSRGYGEAEIGTALGKHADPTYWLRPWSPDEDARLLELVRLFADDFFRISLYLFGRNARQCRIRWNDYIRPGMRTAKFTIFETETFIECALEFFKGVPPAEDKVPWIDFMRFLDSKGLVRRMGVVRDRWRLTFGRAGLRAIVSVAQREAGEAGEAVPASASTAEAAPSTVSADELAHSAAPSSLSAGSSGIVRKPVVLPLMGDTRDVVVRAMEAVHRTAQGTTDGEWLAGRSVARKRALREGRVTLPSNFNLPFNFDLAHAQKAAQELLHRSVNKGSKRPRQDLTALGVARAGRGRGGAGSAATLDSMDPSGMAHMGNMGMSGMGGVGMDMGMHGMGSEMMGYAMGDMNEMDMGSQMQMQMQMQGVDGSHGSAMGLYDPHDMQQLVANAGSMDNQSSYGIDTHFQQGVFQQLDAASGVSMEQSQGTAHTATSDSGSASLVQPMLASSTEEVPSAQSSQAGAQVAYATIGVENADGTVDYYYMPVGADGTVDLDAIDNGTAVRVTDAVLPPLQDQQGAAGSLPHAMGTEPEAYF
jgi:hypothetical protein